MRKKSLECGRMHIWALNSKTSRAHLRPWTPNGLLHSPNSALLCQPQKLGPPWQNLGSALDYYVNCLYQYLVQKSQSLPQAHWNHQVEPLANICPRFARETHGLKFDIWNNVVWISLCVNIVCHFTGFMTKFESFWMIALHLLLESFPCCMYFVVVQINICLYFPQYFFHGIVHLYFKLTLVF